MKFFVLSAIVLFSNYKLKTSNEKLLGGINNAQIFCLLYKLIYSSKGSNLCIGFEYSYVYKRDLCIGFDHSRECKQQQLTNKETVKGNFHVRVLHYEVFGFAEHHKNAAFGWRCTLTTKRNIDKVVKKRHNKIVNDKFVTTCSNWYWLPYTPKIKEQVELSEPILKKVPTELANMERYVCMNELTFKNCVACFEKVFKV